MTGVAGARTAVRAALARTAPGRSLVAAYGDRVVRRQVAEEARRLVADPEGRCVRLICDAGISSPLYGETVQVLMLARFLALGERTVQVVLVDPPLVAQAWQANPDWTREGFLADQVELAGMVLPESVGLVVGMPIDEARSQGDTADARTMFGQVARAGGAVYHLTATLLDVLVADDGLPDGFLLTAADLPLGPGAEPWDGAYVAWHVRRGLWANHRDPAALVIAADGLELARRFPHADLMVLSDERGLAQVLGVLEESGLARRLEESGRRVGPQPEQGFAAAMRRVVRGSFYFQRMGGGIATAAAFSQVPYLMLSADRGVHYAHSLRGERVVGWARPDQRFVVRPRDAATVSLSEFLLDR